MMNNVARESLYGFEVREPDRRRTSVNGKKFYNIQQLWQRSHEIIALAIQGFKQSQIAEILSVSPGTVSNTLNSELGMKKLSEMREERDDGVVKVSKRVAELADKALKVYEKIFDDTQGVSLSLQKATADTVLMDLGGHRAPTKIESKSLHATATMEEIEEFKQRGIAAAKESGMIVEVTDETPSKTV
jgi:predicted transcriptional regulator